MGNIIQPAGLLGPDVIDPSAISGLQLRLESDVGVTVTGSGVSTWADQSGNSNDFTQTVDADRPPLATNVINGLPVVRGDGVSDHLVNTSGPIVAGSATKTIFMVVDPKTIGGGTLFMDGQRNNPPSGDDGRFQRFTPSLARVIDDTGNTTFADMTANEFHAWIYSQTAADIDSYTLQRDDDTPLTPSASASNIPTVAGVSSIFAIMDDAITPVAGNYYAADFAALLIYSPALSSANIQNVFNYLANKYAL